MKCRENLLVVSLVIICSWFSVVSPSLSITDIKDTYTIFKDEFKHLSPTHGMLCWDLIARYYEIGDGRDASVKLVHQLFHEVQGALNITMKPALPPTHFSAKTIGKIVAGLELLRLKKIEDLKAHLIGNEEILKQLIAQKKTLKDPTKAFEQLFSQAKGMLLQDADFQTSVKQIASEYAKILSDGEKIKKDITVKLKPIKEKEKNVQKLWGDLKTSILNKINQNDNKKKLIQAYGASAGKVLGKIISGKAKKKDYESNEIKKAFFSSNDVASLNIEERRSKVLEELKKQEVLKDDLGTLIDLEQQRAAVQLNIQELKVEADDIGSKLNKYDCFTLLSSLIEFVDNLQKSFEESGGIGQPEDQKYITYFPITCLLVFLCRKVDTKKQLRAYFDAVQEVLGGKGVVLLAKDKSWTSDVYKISDVEEGKKFIEKLTEKKADQIDIVSDLDDKYELLVFTVLKDRSNLPKPIKFKTVSFDKKVAFPNCAETVMRLLSNIAVFNPDKGHYSIDWFLKKNSSTKKENIDSHLIEFYNNFPSNDHSDSQDAHEAWNSVVQNMPGIVYKHVVSKGFKTITVPGDAYGFIYFLDENNNAVTDIQALKTHFISEESKFIEKAIHEEKFVQIELHKVTYLVFDPKKLKGYEIRANLKNVIVLLNRIFGFGLFNNKNMPNYHEEKFQSKYFHALCDKLGWRYYQSISDEHNASDSIQLQSRSFDSFSIDIRPGHADYNLLSQNRFYQSANEFIFSWLLRADKFSTEKSMQMLRIHLLNLFSPGDLGEFIAKELAEEGVGNFITADYLKYYVYFLVDTRGDAAKIILLKSLIEQRASFDDFIVSRILNTVDALSKPEDLVYQEQALEIMLKNRNLCENSEIKKKIVNLWKLIFNRKNTTQTMRVLAFFMQSIFTDQYKKQAEELAQKNIASDDTNEKAEAFNLLLALQDYEKAFVEALKFQDKWTHRRLIFSVIEMFRQCVEHDYNIDQLIMQIKNIANNDQEYVACKAFKILVKKGYGVVEALSLAKGLIATEGTVRDWGLQLLGTISDQDFIKAKLESKELDLISTVREYEYGRGTHKHLKEYQKLELFDIIKKLVDLLKDEKKKPDDAKLQWALNVLKDKLILLGKQLGKVH